MWWCRFKSSLFWPTPKLNISKPKLSYLLWLLQIHGGSTIRRKKQKSNGNFRKRKKDNENEKKSLMKKQTKVKSGEEKGKTQSNEENAVNDSYLSDEEENSNSENENEDFVNINHIVEICQNDIKENSYVVVCYDNQYYPGIIVELDGDGVRVKTMVRSGPTGWKWPTPDDVIWYSRSDSMEIIEQPNFAAVNKRGVFHVPKMQKYKIFPCYRDVTILSPSVFIRDIQMSVNRTSEFV
ncbi:hypothetical protein JTB14_027545 [Gonioctena quinquepunctata]|nr:hypothetical protein JTB14_027545 [Gonioctena quinquepunctata]